MTHPTHIPLKVLVACEKSGIVRQAFDRMGHDVWSCDTKPAEDQTNRHIQGDVRDVLDWGWDLLIVAHPPCIRLCNSGVRWITNPERIVNPHMLAEDFTDHERESWFDLSPEEQHELMQTKLRAGAELFSMLWNVDKTHGIGRVVVENPVMHRHAKALIENYEKFAQSLQPWQFGDWQTKRTCWWIKGLDPLVPEFTTVSEAREALGLPEDAVPEDRVHKMSPGAKRSEERSRFFPGMAEAMARQWGRQYAS